MRRAQILRYKLNDKRTFWSQLPCRHFNYTDCYTTDFNTAKAAVEPNIKLQVYILLYKDERLFVCMELIQLHISERSEPNFAHLFPLVWRRS
jgi:hypothetical protein